MYLARNIVESAPLLSLPSSSSAEMNSSNELTQRRHQLVTLRKKYLQLLSENQRTLQDCNQKEQLISQMNSALFKYRVGVQVLDRYEVTPLNDSIGQLHQHANQLKSLTAHAEGILRTPPPPLCRRQSAPFSSPALQN
jgi:hypothetical protein